MCYFVQIRCKYDSVNYMCGGDGGQLAIATSMLNSGEREYITAPSGVGKAKQPFLCVFLCLSFYLYSFIALKSSCLVIPE